MHWHAKPFLVAGLSAACLFVTALQPVDAAKTPQPPSGNAPAGPAPDSVPENAGREATITLNFKDSDIREVAAGIGEITGKNFILDPRVKGRVTVISAEPISLDAVYATFLSVLAVHGYAAIPGQAGVTKIVPASDARELAGFENLGAAYQGPDDQVVTQVIELSNVPAAQLVAILRPLVPQYGHLAAYQPSNMLIISATAANVRRILRIVHRIDQASDDEIEILPLQHASAGNVVQTLQSLVQAAAQTGANPVTLVADERTNSVLISGDKSARLRLTAIISHLDTPLESGGNTQVVYLNYADAENVANILKGYTEETGQGGNASGGGQAPGASAIQENVSIIPDTDLNALVITAPPKQMRNLQGVIDKLDIRRAQVLVDGIIAEITVNRAAELGVTWAAGSEDDGVAGFTNFSGSGAGVVQLYGATQAGDQALGNLPDGISLGFGRIQDGVFSFAGLLRALAGDGTTNILSTPSLLTVDNEEAEIQVGQEVPFLTGSYSNTGTGGGGTGGGIVNPFQTIQREEVGIKLKIKPQINEGDAVIMEIEQEVSSIASGSSGAVDLITNKRTLKTHVIAESGEIIVLGGLIDDQLQESEQSVPLLGSLPLIGNLFRYDSTSKVKRNLMIFIQPTILTDGLETRNMTESKYKYIRAIQLGRQQGGERRLLPEATRPVLPEYEDAQQNPLDEGGQKPEPTDAETEPKPAAGTVVNPDESASDN